jgi:hypothetical protein
MARTDARADATHDVVPATATYDDGTPLAMTQRHRVGSRGGRGRRSGRGPFGWMFRSLLGAGVLLGTAWSLLH